MTLIEGLNVASKLRLKGRKMESCKGSFEDILMEAVDEGFSSLGGSCKQTIYFRLEDCYKIGKHEIPYRIGDFVDVIEQIFGLGAKVIEVRIMQALHGKVRSFRYFPDQEELSLKDYIESLRHFLLS